MSYRTDAALLPQRDPSAAISLGTLQRPVLVLPILEVFVPVAPVLVAPVPVAPVLALPMLELPGLVAIAFVYRR